MMWITCDNFYIFGSVEYIDLCCNTHMDIQIHIDSVWQTRCALSNEIFSTHAHFFFSKPFSLVLAVFFPFRDIPHIKPNAKRLNFFFYLLGSFDLLPLAKMTKIAKTKYNHVDFFIRVYDACSAWASPSFSQIATNIRSKFCFAKVPILIQWIW